MVVWGCGGVVQLGSNDVDLTFNKNKSHRLDLLFTSDLDFMMNFCTWRFWEFIEHWMYLYFYHNLDSFVTVTITIRESAKNALNWQRIYFFFCVCSSEEIRNITTNPETKQIVQHSENNHINQTYYLCKCSVCSVSYLFNNPTP